MRLGPALRSILDAGGRGRGRVAEWAAFVCHGSHGEPMVNQPGRLLVRGAMWLLFAVAALCTPVGYLLTWAVRADVGGELAIWVLRAIVLVIHPVSTLVAVYLFLIVRIWPRRKVPGPLAFSETRNHVT